MTSALVRRFRQQNTITLQQAATWLVSTFSVQVTLATVGNYCRRLNITYKKATKAYTEMDETRAAQWLQDIAVDFGPHVIALDEAAFFYNHVRGYAWSRKGDRAIVKRPGQRGQAHSLLLCIGTNGVVHWQLYTGAVKAVNFIEFLRELPSGSRLVLDNCQIHRATNVLRRQGLPTVAETALEHKVELRYLPPYAPLLNPVELCFNAIRTHVNRERPRTKEDLDTCITAAVGSLDNLTCEWTMRKVFQL